MSTKITEELRAQLLDELRAQNAAHTVAEPPDPEEIVGETVEPAAADRTVKATTPATKTASRPDRVTADAAFLMANPDLRDALETLAHRGKGGELEETRWRRMLGLTENGLEMVTDELFAHRLADVYDSGDLFERWSQTSPLSAGHIAGVTLAEKSGVECARGPYLWDFTLFTSPISRHPKSAYASQGL